MTAPVDAKLRRFREIWKWLVPGWLQEGDGELVQYTEGVMLDAFQESCHQTAKLMLPSVCVEDALARIGSDRGIPRGFAEPEASYRERLRRWRYPRGHRIRGNAPALLEQIAAVFGDAAHTLYTIDARGTRCHHGDDATERGISWDWDGEPLTPNWGRFWLYVRPGTFGEWPSFADGAWGPTIANPDVCVGMSNMHPGQAAAIKRLCKVGRLSWVPAGRRAIYAVFDINGEGFPTPNGTWDSWETRSPLYRYFPLHPSIT